MDRKPLPPTEKTIVSKYDGLTVHVVNERLPKGRLWAQAAGLNIYLVGTAKGTAMDRLTNMACNMALELHIPLISLKYVDKVKK